MENQSPGPGKLSDPLSESQANRSWSDVRAEPANEREGFGEQIVQAQAEISDHDGRLRNLDDCTVTLVQPELDAVRTRVAIQGEPGGFVFDRAERIA